MGFYCALGDIKQLGNLTVALSLVDQTAELLFPSSQIIGRRHLIHPLIEVEFSLSTVIFCGFISILKISLINEYHCGYVDYEPKDNR